MKYLSENKIDMVNQIAEAICTYTCSSDNCGMCQLAQLKSGIEFVFADHITCEDAVKKVIDNFRVSVSKANAKYDDRFALHTTQKGRNATFTDDRE